MNLRRVVAGFGKGLAALLLFGLLLVLFVIWRLPMDTIVLAALPHVEAKSGLRLDYRSVSPVLGGVRMEGFSVNKAKQRWMYFKELEARLGVFSLLTARPALSLNGTLSESGSLDAEVQFVFGDLYMQLHTKKLPLSPINGLLSQWGASVTSALDLDLQLKLPLATPNAVTGSLSLEMAPVNIYGGPMAAGFGLERVNIVKIRGKKEITNGVLDDLDLMVDGDDVWGHLRFSLHLRQPMGASSYSFIPEIKFRDEIAQKLIPVLPMVGLVTNGKGYYTKTFRGSLSKL